jgi:hypothetical protein
MRWHRADHRTVDLEARRSDAGVPYGEFRVRFVCVFCGCYGSGIEAVVRADEWAGFKGCEGGEESLVLLVFIEPYR